MRRLKGNIKVKKLQILYFIQILILLIVVAFMLIQYIKIPEIKVPITDWSSKYK